MATNIPLRPKSTSRIVAATALSWAVAGTAATAEPRAVAARSAILDVVPNRFALQGSSVTEVVDLTNGVERFQLREQLAALGEVDEDSFNSRLLTCYLPRGNLHVWFAPKRSEWTWWTVTRPGAEGPKFVPKTAVPRDSITAIIAAARALA